MSAGLAAQSAPAPAAAEDSLHQMNDSFQALTRKVSPAVVKIVVSGYGPVEEDGRAASAVIGRQRSVGSGVIVDPSGYIITNAHVVAGAQHVRVMLTGSPAGGSPLMKGSLPRTMEARIVGLSQEADLAVVKVEAVNLPTISLGAIERVNQGQVVLAFGSPEGLENTVTLGLVSAVLRQPDPDKPMVYIQTDAAINPGNSGGPLVDVDGNLVGINTFILSQSGGSEGLGFAIPSPMVRFVYGQIRKYGHVHRGQIGLMVQTVTPPLASALGLKHDAGVIVSDLLPGGPAEESGLKTQDIIVAMDGRPVGNLAMFEAALYLRKPGAKVKLNVWRGGDSLEMDVPVIERPHTFDKLADIVNPEKSLVPVFGILGVEIDQEMADLLGDLRIKAGVIVAAKAADPGRVETGLVPGDVIHSLNGVPIVTLNGLREAVAQLKSGAPVAIQIERQERLMYLSFYLE